jgi:hypothetical protein
VVPGEPLLVIGYSSRALHAYVAPFVGYTSEGQMAVAHVANRGMSGSPVLNSNGEVVGVLVALKVKSVLACALGRCEREPKYYAETIDRAVGLVSGALGTGSP